MNTIVSIAIILSSVVLLASANNCPGAGSSAGVNCNNVTACCGAGTITPSCLPDDGSKSCCTWYKASAQCDAGLACLGQLGPGASSSASCCTAGKFACTFGTGSNTCCNNGGTCCGVYSSFAWCCAGAEQCGEYGACYPKCAKTCGTNEKCCPTPTNGELCYNPNNQHCTVNANNQPLLCDYGKSACNNDCYDYQISTCSVNDQGQHVLCPNSAPNSCGPACYSTSQYKCVGGQLQAA